MKEDVYMMTERAWDLLKAGERDRAEQLFTLASEKDPGSADPWNGLGAVYFEYGDLASALEFYMKARDVAEESYGGTFPDRIAWDEEGKPALRAMHGVGLALFRMGRSEEAERAFRDLLECNPEDNQGARFLLADIASGSDPWKDKNVMNDDDDL